jgi:hypothetical protein
MAHVNRFHVRSLSLENGPPTSKRMLRWAAVISTASIALMACGSDDDSSTASESAATVAPAGNGDSDAIAPLSPDEASVATDAPAETASPGGSGDGGETVAPRPDRLLIVEVTVGVEVADVGAAVNDLIAIGQHYDAQVYGSDVHLNDSVQSRGSVIFKVPPQNVEAMIAEASALGRQVTRLQNTDDVTDRVTDLGTRITTAQQSVDRVQRLLVEAVDLGDVVLLEGELTARQTVLEQLLAEQRNLGNRTALATLTIDLSTTPAAAIDPEMLVDTDAHQTGIGDAFASGGRAFVIAAAAVLIFIGYTAPFLAVALVGGSIAWWISRRRARRSRSAAPLLPPTQAADQQTTEPDSAGAARS